MDKLKPPRGAARAELKRSSKRDERIRELRDTYQSLIAAAEARYSGAAREEEETMNVFGNQTSDNTSDSEERGGQLTVPEPASQQEQTPTETSLTHYTISEDATGAGRNNKLYAIKGKGDNVQPSKKASGASYSENINSQTRHHNATPPPNMHAQAQIRAFHAGTGVIYPPRANQSSIQELNQTQTQLNQAKSNFIQDQNHTFSNSTDDPRNDYSFGDQADQGGFGQNLREDTLPTTEMGKIDLILQLLSHIQELEAENDSLRSANNLEASSQAPVVNIQVFHCLVENDVSPHSADDATKTYLSAPYWEARGEEIILRGEFLIADPDGYLETQGDVSFIIYKTYTVNHQRSALIEAARTKQPLPEPEPARQDVQLASDEMREAVAAFFDQTASLRDEFPSLLESTLLEPPYLWWYHYRRSHSIHLLEPRQGRLVRALTDWIEATYAPLYDTIDDQFLRGKVTPMSMQYLFRPGRVLVLETNGLPQGFLTRVPPVVKVTDAQPSMKDKHEKKQQWSWVIEAARLKYEGELRWSDVDLELEVEADSEDQEVDIASLRVVPLTHSSREVRKLLELRGRTFWMCRDRKLVSYEENATNNKYTVSSYCVYTA